MPSRSAPATGVAGGQPPLAPLPFTRLLTRDPTRAAAILAAMRPAMYEAYHGIFNLSRLDDADTATFDVVGPVCESSDVLGRARPLPLATGEDDVILVADAGAYGMAMANTYNLRALPAQDAIE